MKWLQSPLILHPLAGANPHTLWRNLRENRPFTLRSLPARMVACFATLVLHPRLRVEQHKHGAAVNAHQLPSPPLFLVGHWRSGTTHLHNLLSQDPQFAYLNMIHTTLPWVCLTKFSPVRKLIEAVLPEKRGMDEMDLGVELPQEEEMALSCLNDLSFCKSYYFPQQMEEHFRRAVLFEGVTQEELDAFESAYRYLLKKVSYARGGDKRLLLKNPASTGRLRFLDQAFPGASFISIVRHPDEVYGSMERLWAYLTEAMSWQSVVGIDFKAATLRNYRLIMQRYLEERKHIDRSRLVEVRFEDLVERPIEVLETIYARLGIGGYEASRPLFENYLKSVRSYRQNQYALSPEESEQVRKDWDFAFDVWGYPR